MISLKALKKLKPGYFIVAKDECIQSMQQFFWLPVYQKVAIYYLQANTDAAAQLIIKLIENNDIYLKIVKRCKSKVNQLPDQSEKYRLSTKLLREMVDISVGK